MKKFFVFFLFSLSIYSKEWTFMVYLDGDNDLEPYGIDDFLEMSKIGSDENINIVVQFDRVDGYDTKYGDWKTTKRFYIEKGMTPIPGSATSDIGEANMGSPNTLRDFINWAKNNYPAKRYALIIWNHGDGWRILKKTTKAVCDDWTDKDMLYMSEVREAIMGFKLDLIGFDACLQQMVEVAYALRNLSDYLVGSEEVVPDDGWPYDTILSDLKKDPAISAKDLGGVIVKKYKEFYENKDPKTTLSAGDMSRLESLVRAIDDFANSMSYEAFETQWENIKRAREAITAYYDSHSIDIYHFADKVERSVSDINIKNASRNLKNTLNSFIIANYCGFLRGPNTRYGSYGIAIYFPIDKEAYDNDPDSYAYEEGNTRYPVDYVKNHQWDNFIRRFYSYEVKISLFLPQTATTYQPFPIRIELKNRRGENFQGTITLSNTTNSISPTTIFVPGIFTGFATITTLPNQGQDTITVRFSSSSKKEPILVFLNPSVENYVGEKDVLLFIPKDSLTTPTTIHIQNATPPYIPNIKPVVSYEIFSSPTTAFKGEIIGSFSYSETGGIVKGTIREQDLLVFAGTTPIPSFVDVLSNTIIATITYFSLFTIGGTPTYPEIIEKPPVFPNPFIWKRHSFITFGDPHRIEKKLPARGSIRIYTISGELIDELFIEPKDLGIKRWNVKEKDLASGVYLFVINKKAFGKIGIIR